MNQLFASYARGKEAKELATILGDSALSKTDQTYARFAEEFEKEDMLDKALKPIAVFLTLDLSWELLSILPK